MGHGFPELSVPDEYQNDVGVDIAASNLIFPNSVQYFLSVAPGATKQPKPGTKISTT
jgi:hypothetical protein